MTKPEIRTEIMEKHLEGMRSVLREEQGVQAIIGRINLVPNPDMTKCGYYTMDYYKKES